MNSNIEVIQDNAGGITVQNTETKAVAYFQDTAAAKFDLKSILAGDDMSDWDLSDPDHYITDNEYARNQSSGGYRILTEDNIKELIA
jgi:hypothetical protein